MVKLQSLADAEASGAKTYEGNPCRKCGATTRYTRGQTCVACGRKSAQASFRKLQLKASQEKAQPGSTFTGAPCGTCGGTLRYVRWERCVTCCRAASKADWRRTKDSADRKEQSRRTWIMRRYGISSEQADLLFLSQGAKCALCGIDKPGGHRGWHIDHCHQTGEVRGVLCNACNWGLGCFRDRTDVLTKAVEYLRGDEQRDARMFFAREAEWLLLNVPGAAL